MENQENNYFIEVDRPSQKIGQCEMILEAEKIKDKLNHPVASNFFIELVKKINN
jgi:hypothetical protein